MAAALDGVRVLELARVAPVQFCTMVLSDMGAEVIRVEKPEPGMGRMDEAPAARLSHLNRNKRSIAIDLKHPQGQAVLQRLAQTADVLVDGFRPGVLGRLGASYERLSERNPRLIYCSMSGFGQDGPDAGKPAHDLNFIARAGVLDQIGPSEGAPVIPLNLVADYGGAAMHGIAGILLALYARSREGTGQFVDISYLDSTLALLAATPGMRRVFADSSTLPSRGRSYASGSFAYYSLYKTSDGRFITVACTEQHIWERFCRVVDRPDLIRFGREESHEWRSPTIEEAKAREALAAIIETRTLEEWLRILTPADVCVAGVQSVAEVLRDAQLAHRNMIVNIDDGHGGSVRQFGTAIKLSATPGSARKLAPKVGEDTSEIMESLNLKSAVGHLRKIGVIA